MQLQIKLYGPQVYKNKTDRDNNFEKVLIKKVIYRHIYSTDPL